MAMNLNQKVTAFLRGRPEEKFTARQIAEHLFMAYPEECREKKTKSQALKTDTDLLQQLVAEIGARRSAMQKKLPALKVTEGRPRKYYFSEKSDVAEAVFVEHSEKSAVSEAVSPEQAGEKSYFTEHQLYPLLSAYLLSEFGVYSLRIDEKRSANRRGPGGNRWLYPDLVGLEDVGQEWRPEVKECVALHAGKRAMLWSFEVKRLINRSNVRECYFQAVSNSSWANVGYLVAAEIEGPDTLKELRMLYAAHGVGLIQLDVENPSESQALIPARERAEVDWDAANRLAEENEDFRSYIKLIKQFYQTSEIRARDWEAPSE